MTNQTDPILSEVSPSFTNIGNYIQSGTNIFNSDIVFQGGFDEQYYVIQNYSGTLPFNFPCSISGANSVTATIIPHNITGTIPVWVSINSDYQHLDVTAPAFQKNGSNDYYFGVNSNVLSENFDKYVTLTVFE